MAGYYFALNQDKLARAKKFVADQNKALNRTLSEEETIAAVKEAYIKSAGLLAEEAAEEAEEEKPAKKSKKAAEEAE